jgi:hypothetical protein
MTPAFCKLKKKNSLKHLLIENFNFKRRWLIYFIENREIKNLFFNLLLILNKIYFF